MVKMYEHFIIESIISTYNSIAKLHEGFEQCSIYNISKVKPYQVVAGACTSYVNKVYITLTSFFNISITMTDVT